MKDYKIYFELFGKKMKTSIKADSEIEGMTEWERKELLEKVIFNMDATEVKEVVESYVESLHRKGSICQWGYKKFKILMDEY